MKKFLFSLLFILAASVVGLGIGAASYFAYYVPKQAEPERFHLADNGLTGSDTDTLLPPVQQDPRIAEVAERVTSSVITLVVEIDTPYEYSMALGSGVIYREDQSNYFAITNAHVLEDATYIYLYTPDSDMIPIREVGRDEELDLAVVRIPKNLIKDLPEGTYTLAQIGDSDSLRSGDTVITVGSPQDIAYQNSVTVGIVSHPNREIDFRTDAYTYIQIDAAINPGNSGGGLFDIEGRLVGINSNKFVLVGLEGLGFAIPINRTIEAIKTFY